METEQNHGYAQQAYSEDFDRHELERWIKEKEMKMRFWRNHSQIGKVVIFGKEFDYVLLPLTWPVLPSDTVNLIVDFYYEGKQYLVGVAHGYEPPIYADFVATVTIAL